MKAKLAISYLRKLEWSMGCGQCPECCGCKLGFDHVDSPLQRRQGHLKRCKLAAALRELGESVVEDFQPELSEKGKKALEAWNNGTVSVLGALPNG